MKTRNRRLLGPLKPAQASAVDDGLPLAVTKDLAD